MPNFKHFLSYQVGAKLGLLVVALVLVGCASGEPYGTAKSKIPALKSDMGRIFVYRSINPFAVFKPRLFKLDGKNIGDTFASTIIYHDVTPGKHVVNYNSGRSNLTINVSAGGKVYLKYPIVSDTVAVGNTAVEIIDSKTAQGELTGIHLVETMIRNPDEIK